MKVKNISFGFAVIILLTTYTVKAQYDSTWTFAAGGSLMDHSKAIVTDSTGCIYATGGFQSLLSLEGHNIKPLGDTDIFLAKWSKDGKLLWFVKSGSDIVSNYSLSEYGSALVISNDAIYVTGIFMAEAAFGSTIVRSRGDGDIFLAKYTLKGELLWVRSAGGGNQDLPNSIAVDRDGNIYVTGLFQEEAQFGEISLSALNSTEMFLAKYDTQGNVIWARKSAGELKCSGKAIKCVDDYCIVAGNFEGLVDFNETTLSAAAEEVFVNKYNLEGDLIWSKKIAEGPFATVEDIELWRGSIYVAGAFSGKIFSSGKVFSAQGCTDAFVSKLDLNGNSVWVKTFGGTGCDIVKSLDVTGDNQILVAGNFQQNFKLNNAVLTSQGSDDMFILSMARNGVINWSASYGGPGQDQLNSITSLNKTVSIAGYFMESVAIGQQTYKSNGSSDIIIARVVLSPNKLEPVQESSSVTIYPNPASSHFYVESEESIESIKIYGLLGPLVYENNVVRNHKTEISLKGASPGIYIVKVRSKNELKEIKLLLKE